MGNKKGLWIFIGVVVLGLAGFFGWKYFHKPPAAQQQAVGVKVFTAVQKDAAITYEFVGDIQAKNEVKITPRVSGLIIERYVNGGDDVTEGQPLFKIDPRDYETSVTSNRSQVLSAEVTYNRAQQDRVRFEQLLKGGAISQQQYDIALASEQEALAQVNNLKGSLTQSELNLGYTVVRAPMSGKIGVDLMSAGTFATSGQTILATVSSMDPVQVQFSINETDYLKFARMGGTTDFSSQPVKMMLSDGSEYPELGKIVEIDRGLNQQTGTLSMKAQFNNPKNILLPSMFARVQITGEVRKNAILIPQRAVYMQLTKSFVSVVNEEGKAEARPVTVGAKVGQLIIVESGIKAGDKIITEGQIKATPGTPVQVTEIQESDLKIESPNSN